VLSGKPYLYEWLNSRGATSHSGYGFKLWYLSRGGFCVGR
jgi:hypothetical protein